MNSNFTRGLTSGPIAATDSSTSGDAIASLLLGTLASANAPYSALPYNTSKYTAFYIEDRWKATARLSLQYGVRYEIPFALIERYNQLNSFATDIQSPLSAAAGLSVRGV